MIGNGWAWEEGAVTTIRAAIIGISLGGRMFLTSFLSGAKNPVDARTRQRILRKLKNDVKNRIVHLYDGRYALLSKSRSFQDDVKYAAAPRLEQYPRYSLFLPTITLWNF